MRIKPIILVLGLLLGAFATISTARAQIMGDIIGPIDGPPDDEPPPPPPIEERHVSTSYTVDPVTGAVIGIVYNCAPGGDNCPVEAP